jgi:hypothetical protein
MISVDDIVFKDCTGKEDDFSANKIVYLGWYGSEAYSVLEYAESYLYSAGVLFKEFKRRAGDYAKLDFLGIPIIFMYRHYCELIIKYLYIKYVHKVKDFSSKDDYEADIKTFLSQGHRVIDLWKCASPIISKLRSRVRSTVPLEALDSYFTQVSAYDSDSMKMRYSIDKGMSAMINGHVKIDIYNLNEKMECLAKAINVLDSEIDCQITRNAPVEKLDDCFQRIKKYHTIYESYLSFLETTIKDEDNESLGNPISDILNPTPEKIEEREKKTELINKLADDALLILEASYYVGRDIISKRITLPKSRDESLYNILTALLEFISSQRHNFEEPLSDRDTIDFWFSKKNDAQLKYINACLGVISPYYLLDNILE